jgi:hypothetical protein
MLKLFESLTLGGKLGDDLIYFVYTRCLSNLLHSRLIFLESIGNLILLAIELLDLLYCLFEDRGISDDDGLSLQDPWQTH